MKKNLYIIAGCNGAGKTTASFTILPYVLDCREFVNADEIAKGLLSIRGSLPGLEDNAEACSTYTLAMFPK